uniref:Uncharacterized protein n=1 Tax=Romanomermis culicivorax TaxID=13658 RepID=A0A915J5G5_ROMCU
MNRMNRQLAESPIQKLLLDRLLREADDLFRTYWRKPSATCSTGGRVPVGMDLWCPRKNQLKNGRQAWTCMNSKNMCDDRSTCPLSDDEDPIHCMFFRAAYIRLSEIKNLIVDILTHSRKSRSAQDLEQLKNNLLLI